MGREGGELGVGVDTGCEIRVGRKTRTSSSPGAVNLQWKFLSEES